MKTQQAGQLAEKKALAYLINKGLKLVTQNYRCRLGEIDLIMRDGAYLVIIEVRQRSQTDYGGGIGSITSAKQKKIMRATSHYLMTYNQQDRFPIRFDVLSIDGLNDEITWIDNAFTA